MSESWRDSAACANTDPNLFFEQPNSYDGDVVSTGNFRAAKLICGECPVVAECLRDALDTGDVHFGVRGGLPPRGRRRLRDEQRDAA